MRGALGWLLALALVVHLGAHVAIAIGLARDRRVARAALAFLLPPLAPLWGWREGMRRRVLAWAGALACYAIGVALS